MNDREDRWVDIFLVSSVVILVILKVTGLLKLSWLTVFAPILIIVALGGTIICTIFGIAFIKGIIDIIKENKKNERN